MTHPAAKKKRADESLRRRFARLNDVRTQTLLGGNTVRILYWGANPDRCTDPAPHAHSFFEVCFVFRGRGTFDLEGVTHRLTAGNLFVSRPEQVHRIDTAKHDPMGIFFWAFTLEESRAQSGRRPIDELAKAFAASSRNLATLKTKSIEQTLDLLTDEAARSDPGFETAAAALTQKLILDTFRALLDDPMRRQEPGPERATHASVQIAERFLRDNFRRAITIDDVAKQVHLSPRHLSRLFLGGVGVSIAKHLTDLRIEAAGRLLLEGKMNIKQIASDCGYPDVAYFTTLFRKITGFTPGVYREMRGQVYPLRWSAGAKNPRPRKPNP